MKNYSTFSATDASLLNDAIKLMEEYPMIKGIKFSMEAGSCNFVIKRDGEYAWAEVEVLDANDSA
jgi:hypothetical protein